MVVTPGGSLHNGAAELHWELLTGMIRCGTTSRRILPRAGDRSRLPTACSSAAGTSTASTTPRPLLSRNPIRCTHRSAVAGLQHSQAEATADAAGGAAGRDPAATPEAGGAAPGRRPAPDRRSLRSLRGEPRPAAPDRPGSRADPPEGLRRRGPIRGHPGPRLQARRRPDRPGVRAAALRAGCPARVRAR